MSGGDIQGVLSGAGFAALSALFLSEVTATIWELRWMELAIFVLVVADFCWGIADSVAKRGEDFHFSRAGRRTACKLLEYNFYLVGGSEETHEKMTETAIKVNEKISRKGKRLADLSPEEFADLIREASGK